MNYTFVLCVYFCLKYRVCVFMSEISDVKLDHLIMTNL